MVKKSASEVMDQGADQEQMENRTLEELQADQTADIKASWIDGRMLRKVQSDSKMRVIIISGGKIADDFYVTADEDGETLTEISAVWSLKGERATEKTMKLDGFTRAKNVRFNTMTREINIL